MKITLISIVILAIVGTAGYFGFNYYQDNDFGKLFAVPDFGRDVSDEVDDDTGTDGPGPSVPVACTADAKICPDGSAVGRVGPNCEFAQCPVGDDDHSGPSQTMTQAQAETLITQQWSDCSQGDCSSVSVTFVPDRGEQYLITAIFAERDDSVKQTKRELLAGYDNNGGWIPAPIQPSPNTWRTCHRGNADGTEGWTVGDCI